MASIIQIRRDTAANWTSLNPTLAQGEIGYETDTNKFKFGNGTTAWNSLSYFGIGSGVTGVSSFNTRTGAVVPATNDYTWAQIDKTTSSLADVTNHSHTVLTDIGTNTHAQIDTFIASKGANSGLATLDSGGKIPVTQLPSSVMQYLGTWDASTNTPTLTDGGAFVNGDVYLCSVAGSTNFGHGAISFAVGDWAVYNGTIWQKSLNSNAVVSVNGYAGVVSLTKSDVGLGNVENTALSTWAGTTNITTLGTIATGTWQGTAIADAYISSASTWNAKQAALTFSTGLTNTANTITNNLSVGVSGGQTAIGGTGVTDILKLKGTTGNGTLTSPAIQALVGNNGGTTALTILNNGNVGIGTTSPGSKLVITGATSDSTLAGLNVTNSGATSLLYVRNDGNIGIGTTSPGTTLDVFGTGRIKTSAGVNNPFILDTTTDVGSAGASVFASFRRAGSERGYIGFGSAGGYDISLANTYLNNGGLNFLTNATSRMYISNGGNVGIGTTSPNSLLHNNGSFALPIVSKTANYTLTSSDYTVIASGAGTTITLPTAVNIQGRIYVIKRNDSTNNITLNTTSSQTIDGATSLTLSTNYQVIMVQSDNANWQIISAQ